MKETSRARFGGVQMLLGSHHLRFAIAILPGCPKIRAWGLQLRGLLVLWAGAHQHEEPGMGSRPALKRER